MAQAESEHEAGSSPPDITGALEQHSIARARTAARIGALTSLTLHAAIVALLAWVPPLPDLDFELELPAEVDFGAPDAEPEQAPPEPSTTDTPEPVTSAEPAPETPPTPEAPPAPDPNPKPKPKPPKPKPELPSGPLLAAYAPKGTQLHLRLDVEQVRASPLSEDVRLLLQDAPDVRAVLEGSGIDAIRDLQRLYLASPDLRRESFVMAGRYAQDAELARRAVAALAARSGQPATWRTRQAIEVAPWHDADATERSVALLGGNAFVITRSKDLNRVLAVARAMPRDALAAPTAPKSSEPAEGGRGDAPPAARDALLDLEPGVAAHLTVFDARRFARGNLRGVPLQLEVQARIRDDGGVSARITGTFESEAAATSAAEYWTRVRERFAAHPLVALVGMRGPLVSTQIKTESLQVVALAELTQQQARTLLGFVRSSIAPPRPPPRTPPPSAAPPAASPSPASPRPAPAPAAP